MLITRLRIDHLLGKKVYGVRGNYLGEVVGVAGRRGCRRAVLVRSKKRVGERPSRLDSD